MTDVGYLAAGYSAAFAIVSAYAAWIVGRKRALARELPPDERDPRWR